MIQLTKGMEVNGYTITTGKTHFVGKLGTGYLAEKVVKDTNGNDVKEKFILKFTEKKKDDNLAWKEWQALKDLYTNLTTNGESPYIATTNCFEITIGTDEFGVFATEKRDTDLREYVNTILNKNELSLDDKLEQIYTILYASAKGIAKIHEKSAAGDIKEEHVIMDVDNARRVLNVQLVDPFVRDGTFTVVIQNVLSRFVSDGKPNDVFLWGQMALELLTGEPTLPHKYNKEKSDDQGVWLERYVEDIRNGYGVPKELLKLLSRTVTIHTHLGGGSKTPKYADLIPTIDMVVNDFGRIIANYAPKFELCTDEAEYTSVRLKSCMQKKALTDSGLKDKSATDIGGIISEAKTIYTTLFPADEDYKQKLVDAYQVWVGVLKHEKTEVETLLEKERESKTALETDLGRVGQLINDQIKEKTRLEQLQETAEQQLGVYQGNPSVAYEKETT